MDLEAVAEDRGAGYFGIADLTAVPSGIVGQGGAEYRGYPRAVSIGISLEDSVVDRLPKHRDRTVALAYRGHWQEVNGRLDEIALAVTAKMQEEGHRSIPVPASKILDDSRICGAVSHKLAAHLAGHGWIGKNCLLITPDRGPRVRWVTILTDAPLDPTGGPSDERCGDCDECVCVCPVHAFTGRPFHAGEPREARFDAGKCRRYHDSLEFEDGLRPICGLCVCVCPRDRTLIRPINRYCR